MENNGWIKLHRNMLDNCISKKPEFAWLWVTLLLMATHSENSFLWNGKKQILKKGQILTGRKKLAEKTGLNESKVERILKYLESEQQIEQQKTNKFRLITINNWIQYQENEQQSEQQLNNKRTTTEQQLNTYKKVKKVKKVKKETQELIFNSKLDKSIYDFIQYRKSIKKPMTEKAIELLKKKLNTFSNIEEEQIAILEQSIVNGWQGIFELKNDKGKVLSENMKAMMVVEASRSSRKGGLTL